MIFFSFITKPTEKDLNKKEKNYIHLSINIDNKYIYPSLVFLTSLFDNRANSTFYVIHLLTNDQLSNESKKKIKTTVKRFANDSAELIYHDLGDDFKGSEYGYLPVATYYKLALPSLLPNLDKIISTDSDVICLTDLSEMYSIEFKDKMYFAGIMDYINHLTQLREFGLDSNRYINGGILLMNLKAIREDSIEKKLRVFIINKTLAFCDQTAINCVCRNNTQIIPYKYNLFAFDSYDKLLVINNQQDENLKYNESELRKAYDEPTLFHYVSLDKPWKKETTKFNRVYWWYYANMSGFFQEILDHYGFNKNEIEELLKQIPEDGGLLKRNYKKFD